MRTRLLFFAAVLSFSFLAHIQAFPIHTSTAAKQSIGELNIEVKDPTGKAMEASGKLDNLEYSPYSSENLR